MFPIRAGGLGPRDFSFSSLPSLPAPTPPLIISPRKSPSLCPSWSGQTPARSAQDQRGAQQPPSLPPGEGKDLGSNYSPRLGEAFLRPLKLAGLLQGQESSLPCLWVPRATGSWIGGGHDIVLLHPRPNQRVYALVSFSRNPSSFSYVI